MKTKNLSDDIRRLSFFMKGRKIEDMRNLSSWLLVMFMAIFWVFRIIVAYQTQYTVEESFGGFIAFDLTIEIVMLFVTVLCMILFLRRSLIGGIIYLGMYGYYFGGYLMSTVLPLITGSEEIPEAVMQNGFVAALAVILALCAFLDLLWSKVNRKDPRDVKTDWYFKGDKYDRELDERADKNQYRNY